MEEGCEADIEDFDAQERISVDTSVNTSVDVSHVKVSFTEKSTHNQTVTIAKSVLFPSYLCILYNI